MKILYLIDKPLVLYSLLTQLPINKFCLGVKLQIVFFILNPTILVFLGLDSVDLFSLGQ